MAYTCIKYGLAGASFITAIACAITAAAASKNFTSEFPGETSFASFGGNWFLPLIPGLFQVLETPNHRVKVVVTVTNRTRIVDGVETRIVTEHEERDGVLTEISDNYEAISTKTNAVYYFGNTPRNTKTDKWWATMARGSRAKTAPHSAC